LFVYFIEDFLTNDQENKRIESPSYSISLPSISPNSTNNKDAEIQSSNSRITTNTSSRLNLISIFSYIWFYISVFTRPASSVPSDVGELYQAEHKERQELFDNRQQYDESLDKNQRKPIPTTIATFDGKANENVYYFPMSFALGTSMAKRDMTAEDGMITNA